MIRMTGIDHMTAPVSIRSVYAVRKSEMAELCRKIKEELSADGIVMIATCNRMEIYVTTEQTDCSVEQVWSEAIGVPAGENSGYFTERNGDEAVRHLMSLTCGLQSAIIAEDQILTQVGDALTFARANYLSDSVLEVLFRMAVSAAKKVKTDVVFTRADSSAIGQAVRLLKERGYSLKDRRCMVIGNGEYGRMAASTLVQEGAEVTVTVRQYHSGMVLIPDGCRQIHYGEKMEYFPECDVVVSATASPNYTLYLDKVKEAMPDHPVIILDFAVPPDVEPGIGDLEQVTLYNIDDFRTQAGHENDEAFEAAGRILEEHIGEFHKWMDYRDIMPHVSGIADAAARDLTGRLSKVIRTLPLESDGKSELTQRIGTASGKVMAKMLYLLRDSLTEEEFRKCVRILENGFSTGE